MAFDAEKMDALVKAFEPESRFGRGQTFDQHLLFPALKGMVELRTKGASIAKIEKILKDCGLKVSSATIDTYLSKEPVHSWIKENCPEWKNIKGLPDSPPVVTLEVSKMESEPEPGRIIPLDTSKFSEHEAAMERPLTSPLRRATEADLEGEPEPAAVENSEDVDVAVPAHPLEGRKFSSETESWKNFFKAVRLLCPEITLADVMTMLEEWGLIECYGRTKYMLLDEHALFPQLNAKGVLEFSTLEVSTSLKELIEANW